MPKILLHTNKKEIITFRERQGRRYIRSVSARYMHREEIDYYEKQNPTFQTDKEAQSFIDVGNLAEYDLSGGIAIQFEFEPKSTHLNMRIPQSLLEAIKERAKTHGMPYTRYIRQLMEREISRLSKTSKI